MIRLGKIAIFVSGPCRYIDEVLKSLNAKLNGHLEYDFFIHLWSEDLGNKNRLESSININEFLDNSKVKSFTIASAYSEKEISDRWGRSTGCHSTINAMVGMFSAINVLISSFKKIPDAKNYSHVLRIRTDCCLFRDFPIPLVLDDKIYVSKNYSIPDSWVSDHIMLAPIDSFFKVWEYKNIEKFMSEFSRSNRNPEKYVSDKVKEFGLNISDYWVRGKDYHIIYNPPKEDDPSFIKKIIENEGVPGIFKYKVSNKDVEEVLEKNKIDARLNKNYDSFYSRFKRIVKRIVG